MEIFILKEKIQPKQRPRFFRGVVYTPSETTKSENHIKKAYLQQTKRNCGILPDRPHIRSVRPAEIRKETPYC